MESYFKGRLKLAVYMNSGHLTVHICKASHLQPVSFSQCNAYVKISLKPDDHKRSQCHTAIVHSPFNQPSFEEKFSFELLEEDLRKRLVIAVWNKNSVSPCVEFLGSMSFGLQHINLKRRVIDGWYYLLDDRLGKRKHLKVNASEEPLYGSHEVVDHYYDYSEPLVHLESHVFVIPLGFPEGFGFGISGESPVQISRVDPGSPADSSGLCVRDRIIRINNINVDYSTAETVGRIIKNSGKQVIVEVQRPVCKSKRPISTQSTSDGQNTYAELSDHFQTDHRMYPNVRCDGIYSASSSSDVVAAGPAQKQQFCARWITEQQRIPRTDLGSGGSDDRSWDELIPKKKQQKKEKHTLLGCVPLRSQKLKNMGQVT